MQRKLKSGKQFYDLEMRQLVGHSYFQKKQYDKAIPYLEAFVNKSDKVSRKDLYELSYSYYQTGNLAKAIEGFKQLGGKRRFSCPKRDVFIGRCLFKDRSKT